MGRQTSNAIWAVILVFFASSIVLQPMASFANADPVTQGLAMGVSLDKETMVANITESQSASLFANGNVTIFTVDTFNPYIEVRLSVTDCPFEAVVSPSALSMSIWGPLWQEFNVQIVVPPGIAVSTAECVIHAIAIQGTNFTTDEARVEIIVPQYFMLGAGGDGKAAVVKPGEHREGRFTVYNMGNGPDTVDITAELYNFTIIKSIEVDTPVLIPKDGRVNVTFRYTVTEDLGINDQRGSTITFHMTSHNSEDPLQGVATYSYGVVYPSFSERLFTLRGLAYVIVILATLVIICVGARTILKRRRQARSHKGSARPPA